MVPPDIGGGKIIVSSHPPNNMKPSGIIIVPFLLLLGCAPVPQTAADRPSSGESSVSALEAPSVVDEEPSVALRVCSETTIQFTYQGGDLITEVAAFLHEKQVTIQIKDLLITTTKGEPIVEIKDGVLDKPIPSMLKGTPLIIQGRVCPDK